MENIRPFSDFEIRTFDSNVSDGTYMAALIKDWGKHVLAMFVIPTSDGAESESEKDGLQLIATQRVGAISPADIRELRDICPDVDGKYFTTMLLIKHSSAPLEHTLTLAFNTRSLQLKPMQGNSTQPIVVKNKKLYYGEAGLAIQALLRYAPDANLVFLRNAPVWKDSASIKKEMSFHVHYQLGSYSRAQTFGSDDSTDGWATEY